MKNTILLSSTLLLLLFACKQDPKTTASTANSTNASPELLAGHWINLDFCSRANQYGSVLDAMTNSYVPYAFALTFDPNRPDSVICYNGMEIWALPAKYNVDTIELVGGRPEKSVFLMYNSTGEKDISMFDFPPDGAKIDRFIKSGAQAVNGSAAFSTALNHHLFNGIFFPLWKGAPKDTVNFTPGGLILKWNKYQKYEVCTAGDCFVAGNEIDIMTLTDAKTGTSELYGFRYSGANDTLTLYNLAKPANSDEKGGYTVKNVAYQFYRKPSQ